MAETQLLAEPVESAADKGTTDNEQADADQLLKKLPESVNVETKVKYLVSSISSIHPLTDSLTFPIDVCSLRRRHGGNASIFEVCS